MAENMLGGPDMPDKDDLYSPQAFSDRGAAWDSDIPVDRPAWHLGMKRQGRPADPNMRTTAPDVGSAPAEWNFPTATRRTMQDT